MIVAMSNTGLLKIDNRPLLRMNSYLQDSPDKPEAGGVLLGRFILNSNNIIVDSITVPMIGDKRTRISFIRGEKMHQRVITANWKKSKGTCNYLGEWHTHPERFPSPSRQDIHNWKEIMSTGIFSGQFLYFIIIGTKQIRIWEGDRKNGTIKRLRENGKNINSTKG